MHRLIPILALLLIIPIAARTEERIELFSDPALTDRTLTDTAPRIVDIYVAHFETLGTTGCNFRIVSLAGFTGVWLGDSSAWYTWGMSQTGIAVNYLECQVGSAVMLKVTYQLFGTSASCSALRITNHPDLFPGVIHCDRCYQEYHLPAISMPVNCGPVATEPTTWGKVKSLYRN